MFLGLGGGWMMVTRQCTWMAATPCLTGQGHCRGAYTRVPAYFTGVHCSILVGMSFLASLSNLLRRESQNMRGEQLATWSIVAMWCCWGEKVRPHMHDQAGIDDQWMLANARQRSKTGSATRAQANAGAVSKNKASGIQASTPRKTGFVRTWPRSRSLTRKDSWWSAVFSTSP